AELLRNRWSTAACASVERTHAAMREPRAERGRARVSVAPRLARLLRAELAALDDLVERFDELLDGLHLRLRQLAPQLGVAVLCVLAVGLEPLELLVQCRNDVVRLVRDRRADALN